MNQPMTLEFVDYTEFEDLFDEPTYPAYTGRYRFIPTESGSYFFDILGPDTFYRVVFVTTSDFIGVWDIDSIPSAGKVAYLEGDVEYFIMAYVVNVSEVTGTYQLVARKVVPKWWQTLPSFLQFLLRWICFGWIWMR